MKTTLKLGLRLPNIYFTGATIENRVDAAKWFYDLNEPGHHDYTVSTTKVVWIIN